MRGGGLAVDGPAARAGHPLRLPAATLGPGFTPVEAVWGAARAIVGVVHLGSDGVVRYTGVVAASGAGFAPLRSSGSGQVCTGQAGGRRAFGALVTGHIGVYTRPRYKVCVYTPRSIVDNQEVP